jgi:hypothetical protein
VIKKNTIASNDVFLRIPVLDNIFRIINMYKSSFDLTDNDCLLQARDTQKQSQKLFPQMNADGHR